MSGLLLRPDPLLLAPTAFPPLATEAPGKTHWAQVSCDESSQSLSSFRKKTFSGKHVVNEL